VKECHKHPSSTIDSWAKTAAAQAAIYDIRTFAGSPERALIGLSRYVSSHNLGFDYNPNIEINIYGTIFFLSGEATIATCK
ncbi:MAG: hypothetical protein AB1522_16715, partial [Chloroflexota bacterium]